MTKIFEFVKNVGHQVPSRNGKKNTVKEKGQIHIEVFVTGVQMCGWGAAIEGQAVF